MTLVYEDGDLIAAYRQKKKLFNIYLAIAIIYAAICIAGIVYGSHAGVAEVDGMGMFLSVRHFFIYFSRHQIPQDSQIL